MYYTAIERFDPDNGERWIGYTRWLGRTDLKRIVTLDSVLCPAVVHAGSCDDWGFAAKEDFMLDFFTDLDFVLRRVAGHRPSVVLAVTREPTAADVNDFSDPNFEFAGFDVVDTQFFGSALLSSSRFPALYNVSELSEESGLIRLRKRAFQIRDTLRKSHPDCEKANCYVWAIWRYTGKV